MAAEIILLSYDDPSEFITEGRSGYEALMAAQRRALEQLLEQEGISLVEFTAQLKLGRGEEIVGGVFD